MTERDVDPGVSAREVFIFRAWAMTLQKSALSLCVVSGQGKYLSDLREPLFFFLQLNCKTLRIPHDDGHKNRAEGASSLFPTTAQCDRTGRVTRGDALII